MKRLIINIFPLVFLCLGFYSCEKWTEVEADDFELKGNTAEYYANLRLWKATAGDRPVSFGWFGGWNGEGASMASSLAGLPDSLDMVSIWGDWKTLTEARKKDLEYVQKVKGTKVLICSFDGYVGEGVTPDGMAKGSQELYDYWGWDPNATGKNEEPNDAQKAAIAKYARAFYDMVVERGYDGLDIDHEPTVNGVPDDLAESTPRMKVFIQELSKYFGPKSNTGLILAVDGEPQTTLSEVGDCFDWFIVQAYNCSGYTNLNARLTACVNHHASTLTPEEVAKKYIATENFENATNRINGGCDFGQEDGTKTKSYFGMAAWEPLVNGKRYAKGGCGVYHIEYAYSVAGQEGFYPFTRKAIQIMNPANHSGN
ncbi:MAG: glycoside hydrolase family 18 [Dysgonamonadaceae bacterium]|jgi:hypothetical protein|nr:glycoside hydrolase family 18 [Dysgonamonadaceae bacterium]